MRNRVTLRLCCTQIVPLHVRLEKNSKRTFSIFEAAIMVKKQSSSKCVGDILEFSNRNLSLEIVKMNANRVTVAARRSKSSYESVFRALDLQAHSKSNLYSCSDVVSAVEEEFQKVVSAFEIKAFEKASDFEFLVVPFPK
jgi:hypothetical protein